MCYNNTNLNNYRGISLQNCIAKLFSSVLNDRLNKHYEHIYANQQFGFRANHRTTDSIFILKSLISKYLNKKREKIYACFVDLRKAFDSLWHNGLRYKLIQSKVGKKMYDIISDMYNMTKSAVKLNNKITDFFTLDRGVKQGDSLSPTIFNCYINDLHQIFDNECHPLLISQSTISSLSFADDLVIFSSSHTGLQNALNKLEKYCDDWQLTVNINKTKVMIFQNKYSPTPTLFYKNSPLVETKEYNFLGNVINYTGSFKKAVQELTKKGLKVLFALKSRFSHFQSIPVSLSCKLFDVLIRPVLLYNSEVWLMDEYISILKSLKRAEHHGTVCDYLSLDYKLCFETVHNRYCKSVLGLKKTACNFSAKLELGRFSLVSFIKTQVMLYFCRIKMENVNPLLKEAYDLNRDLDRDGIYTWHSFACNIFKETGLDIKNFESSDKPFDKIKHTLKMRFKKEIINIYSEKVKNKLSAIDDKSKLYLYSKLKSEVKIEDYLLKESNFKNRQMITKFRVSDHILEVELGRYKNIPRENRFCQVCKDEIDDEYHFFLKCKQNSTLRNHLFSEINQINQHFVQLQPLDKLKNILSPEFELLTVICDFIKQSLQLRK